MSDPSVSQLTEGYFRWRCRRGMKELDFIFNRFLDASYEMMTNDQKRLFDELLNEQDMLLWYWMSGKQQPSGEYQHFNQLVKEVCAVGYLKK